MIRLSDRYGFLQEWGRNLTTLMRLVRSMYPNTIWYGWRSGVRILDFKTSETDHKHIIIGSRMSTVKEGEHWNTQHAFNLMLDMNQLSKNISINEGQHHPISVPMNVLVNH
jgi:hypothetical protein